MNEYAFNLPKEVEEFVVECRRQVYPVDAVPNCKTDNPYDYAFRYERDGLVYSDVSTEQNGCFSGEESVGISYLRSKLHGQRFYVCQYAGSDEPCADRVGKLLVAQVKHGMVINHPTLVRFGSPHVRLESTAGGRGFIYQETGQLFRWGRLNRETLFVRSREEGVYVPVYKGSSLLTVFGIK